MSEWADLDRELDAWGRAERTATFWWRDDDAVTTTPALQRLLRTSVVDGQPVPLALAVIPAQADATLAQALSAAGHVVALQHGYAHANHAAATAKKAEFGAGREAAPAELRAGAQRLRELFGERALPVLVPPWNRIDPALVARLGELGLRGLSTYGPRPTTRAADDPIVVNTHIDIIDWRGGRRFLGVQECLQLTLGHLAARREDRVDPAEATGLLTHHLVHDEQAWSFLEVFSRHVRRHPAARWMDARQLFGCGGEEPA